jgi:hypothetical protein
MVHNIAMSKNIQILEKIFSSRENLHKYVDTIYRASIKKDLRSITSLTMLSPSVNTYILGW